MKENQSYPYREFKSFKDRIPLARAFKTGNQRQILQAIHSASNVTIPLTDQNEKALHLACELGDMTLISALLARGADNDICKRANRGGKPINYAVRANCQEAVIKLLSYSHCIENAGELYALMSTAIEHNAPEVLSVLLGHRQRWKINLDTGGFYTSLLQEAIRNKNLACVKLLIHAGANVLLIDEKGISYLHYAAEAGNSELLKALLSTRAKTLINQPITEPSSNRYFSRLDNKEKYFQKQDTPIHVAVRAGNAEVIQLLLRAGARISIKKKDAGSPLKLAVDILVTLTKQKNKKEAITENLYSRHIDIVKILLEANAYRDCISNNLLENLSLFHEVLKTGVVELIQLFVDHGADVNSTDVKSNNALLQVLKSDTTSTLETSKLLTFLLKNNANVSQINKYGYTALHLAVLNNNESAVRILLKTDAKELCHHQLTFTKKYSDIKDEEGHTGDTPLHIALRRKFFSIAKLLLAIEMDVAIRNKSNETALTLGVIANNTEIMRFLLSRVTNKSLLNEPSGNSYHTYLICQAVDDGHIDIVRQLIDAGADVSLRNSQNEHVVYMAVKRENSAMLAFLLSTSAVALMDQPCFKEEKKSQYFSSMYEETLSLHLAIEQDDETCFQLLLTAGAKLYLNDPQNAKYYENDHKEEDAPHSDSNSYEEKQNFYQKNPLQNTLLLIISKNSEKILHIILQYLCEKDSNFLKTYKVHGHPLLYFAITNPININIVKILLKYGADVVYEDPEHGSWLQYVAEQNTFDTSYASTWMTLFHLLWEGGASIQKNAIDAYGNHLLHKLAVSGNIKLMVFLLQQGAGEFLLHKDKRHKTPLDLLSMQQKIELEWVVTLDFNKPCWQTEAAQKLFFKLIALTRYTLEQEMQGYSADDKLIAFLQKLPSFFLNNLLGQESIGETTLLGAAIRSNCKNLVRWLIQKGAALDTYEKDKKTAYASYTSRYLLFTPLALAIQYGRTELFVFLLAKNSSLQKGCIEIEVVSESDTSKLNNMSSEGSQQEDSESSVSEIRDISDGSRKENIGFTVETEEEIPDPAEKVLNSPEPSITKITTEIPLLHLAVMTGELKIVKELLAAKVDVNAMDGKGATALLYAINQDERMVDLLLAASCDINLSALSLTNIEKNSFHNSEDYRENKGKITVTLHDSTRDAVFFEECGDDIITPLKLAVSKPTLLKKLLAAGAKVCLPQKETIPVLFYALADDDCRSMESFNLLVAYGASWTATITTGMTLLMYAAQLRKNWRSVDLFEKILEHCVTLDQMDTYGNTALFYVIRYSDSESENRVKQLISKGAKVNIKNKMGMSPLLLAVAFQRKSIVERLIAAGAEVNVTCDAGVSTVALMANMNINEKMMQLFFKQSLNEQKEKDFDVCPLLLALSFDNRKIFKILLKNGAIFGNSVNQAFHLLASQVKDPELIELVLNQPIPLPRVTEENTYQFNRMMHILVKFDQLSLLEKLINAGFQFYFKDTEKSQKSIRKKWLIRVNNDISGLFIAVQNNSCEMVKLLLTQGAQITINDIYCKQESYTHVYYKHYGEEEGEWDYVYENEYYDPRDDNIHNYLKATIPIDSEWKPKAPKRKEKEIFYAFTLTPLHAAIQNGNEELVDLLLKNGADPNIPIYDNIYPLHMAIALNNSAIVTSLLAHNADVTQICTLDEELKEKINFIGKPLIGGTPIHLAIYARDFSTVEALLERLATLKNSVMEAPLLAQDQPSPIAFAVKQRETAILKLLFLNGLREKPGEGSTLLLIAAKENDEEIFNILIENEIYLEIDEEINKEFVTYFSSKSLKAKSILPNIKKPASYLIDLAKFYYQKITSSEDKCIVSFQEAKLFTVLILMSFAKNIIDLPMTFSQKKRLLSHSIQLLISVHPGHLVNCLDKIISGKLLKNIDDGLFTGILELSSKFLKLTDKALYEKLNFTVATHLLAQEELSKAILNKSFIHALRAGKNADACAFRRQLMNLIIGNQGIPADMQSVGLNMQNFGIFANRTLKIVPKSKSLKTIQSTVVNAQSKDDSMLGQNQNISHKRRLSL